MSFKNKSKNENGFWEILPEDLHNNTQAVCLVDVRRPDEFTGELGHIKGAQLITLETDLESQIDQLPKDQAIVFICRSGGRSGKATQMAQDRGFSEVFNLIGGMQAWNDKGFETE